MDAMPRKQGKNEVEQKHDISFRGRCGMGSVAPDYRESPEGRGHGGWFSEIGTDDSEGLQLALIQQVASRVLF
jgi:hypothetical protein